MRDATHDPSTHVPVPGGPSPSESLRRSARQAGRGVLLVSLGLALAVAATAQSPVPGQVKLPLKDYLAIVERIESADRAEAERVRRREPTVADVVSRETAVVWGDKLAEIRTVLAVDVAGTPARTVPLPVAGATSEATIEPAGRAALRRGTDAVELVAPEPGRYTVKVRSVAELQTDARGAALVLPADAAQVAVTTVDLPADRAWTCPGAVVAADEVRGDRRQLRLALNRSSASTLRAWKQATSEEEEKALVRAVVVTIVQIAAEGLRRHDVVLYEVSRGLLPTFAVTLPEGLEVERMATDEGELPEEPTARRLVVQRSQRLGGIGHLVLTSTVSRGDSLPLDPVVPEVEVRARYLTWAPALAAEASPEPASAWVRVDLDDLPEAIRTATDGLKFSAAWMATAPPSGARLAVSVLPPAPARETVVRSRETTTLLTKDGTLLHRDVFTLQRAGSALAVQLAGDATLWSASVNGLAVRPVQRDGATLLPLPLGAQEGATVDLVVVQERAIGAGRSRIAIAPPRVEAPVLAHGWRLLLPQEHGYRFTAGTLQPAPPPLVVVPGPAGPSRPAPPSRLPPPPPAPRPTGTETGIEGVVVDSEGLPLPGVTIAITREDGKAGSRLISGAEGTFSALGLEPGRYTVRAELAGFTASERSVSISQTGQIAQIQVHLGAASFEESVTVAAETPVIDVTQSATAMSLSPSQARSGSGGTRRERTRKADQVATAGDTTGDGATFTDGVANLKQGLVGGVKPVPVTIPESGKSLFLAGALPPAAVTVELEVKAKR